jgi:hypothetical protein
MTYDRVAFVQAHHKFLTDAKTLTDADLEQFAVIDPKLADRARAKRAGFVEAFECTDAEKRALSQTVTMNALTDWFTDFVLPILATYRHSIQETRALAVALEQRLTATERKQFLKFRGVWEAGTAYDVGDCATCHGSLWVCKAETSGKPGEDFVAWTLAVKKGSA